MIDRRLFKVVDKKPLVYLVCVRWLNLTLSIFIWYSLANLLSEYFEMGSLFSVKLIWLSAGALILKAILHYFSGYLTWQCSSQLRLNLRQKILKKALQLNEKKQLASSVLAQYSVEGINQLELYYARFLPQLFYCLGSAALIFSVLVSYAWQPALLLLICMPLIPIVIMLVMKTAKKILSKYWNSYTDLGRVFAEDLKGLATLKAFDQDEKKQQELKDNAQFFRKATMSLLAMQLNSITIMDLISYCGAASSIILALLTFKAGNIDVLGVLLFVVLSAEFFLPLRQLGSFFHVALNGVSAMQKLFLFLDQKEPIYGQKILTSSITSLKANFSFKYQDGFSLRVKDFELTPGLVAFVGKSGFGKSTLAKLLSCKLSGYTGQILWNNEELADLNEETLTKSALYISEDGYLFKGSLKDNLLIANKNASEAKLKQALAQVNLNLSLDYILSENASNLSGGQRQRLLVAKALVSEAKFFVFDEITAGVDRASEEIIMQNLYTLAKDKIVIFISHRLYNVLDAKKIYVFEQGKISACGTSQELLKTSPYFKAYFAKEQAIFKEENDA